MSSYPDPYGYPAPGQPVPAVPPAPPAGRPAVLTLAVAGGVAAGVLSLVTALLGVVSGRSAVEEELRAGLGVDLADAVGGLARLAVDDAYGTIQARAGVLAVVAVLVVVLSLAALRASVGARIALLPFLLVGLVVLGRTVTDVYPGTGVLTGWAALVISVAVAALLFLPPVNRYRTASAAARTAPAHPGGGYRPVR